MLIFVTNCILTGIFQSSLLYNQSMMISIIVITALISIINFLGMLLPNLTFCPSLRYEEKTLQQPILSSPIQPPSNSSDFAKVPNNPVYPSSYPSSGYDSN